MIFVYVKKELVNEITSELRDFNLEVNYVHQEEGIRSLEAERSRIVSVADHLECCIFDTWLFDPADDFTFLSIIKDIQLSSSGCRVIIITDRAYTDPMLSEIVKFGVYNIISTNDFPSDNDIISKFSGLLKTPNTLRDASRYFTNTEITAPKVKTKIVKEIFEKEVIKEVIKEVPTIQKETVLLKSKRIAVVGTCFGAGASTVSLSLSKFLASKTHDSIGFVEYPDLDYAYISRLLGIAGEQVQDAVERTRLNLPLVVNGENAFPALTNLDITFYPKVSNKPVNLTGNEFTRLFNAIVVNHPTVIIDFGDKIQTVIENAYLFTHVLFVMPDDVNHLEKNIGLIASALSKAGTLHDKFYIVLNKQVAPKKQLAEINEYVMSTLYQVSPALEGFGIDYVVPLLSPEIIRAEMYGDGIPLYYDNAPELFNEAYSKILEDYQESLKPEAPTTKKKQLFRIFKKGNE